MILIKNLFIYFLDREIKIENRVWKWGGNGILKKYEICVLIMFWVCEKFNFFFLDLYLIFGYFVKYIFWYFCES